jgi:ribonuclease P/MRP protein subunit RPP40
LSSIKLLYSYLSNRSQCVRINNVVGVSSPVTSGVPQGSILGPSLFSLVMADLLCLYNTTCLVKYADDITLSVPIFHSSNFVKEEIDNVINWSRSVGLNLNPDKCKYILITGTVNCIPVVIPNCKLCTSLKLLGVYLSDNLKWDLHFHNMSVTANRRAYAFRVIKPYLSTTELFNVYRSLILSVLEYCAPLFVGLNRKNCDVINSIQRRFHNIICGFNCDCNIFPNIHARRQNFAVKLFLNAHSDDNHVLNCIIPNKRTFFVNLFLKKKHVKRPSFHL